MNHYRRKDPKHKPQEPETEAPRTMLDFVRADREKRLPKIRKGTEQVQSQKDYFSDKQ